MSAEVTLEDVEFIISSESNFLGLVVGKMFTGNLCQTKKEVRESRQRLTKALEMLDALIQERELSSLGTARS